MNLSNSLIRTVRFKDDNDESLTFLVSSSRLTG